ncbi:hypothetical protein ADEAN_000249700 [Angomonas deanei]|uniref:Uncharacterized protein n=1 Tax=Angomonas deanei TaxID=59799 RepID=A0A7G2C7H0_9TRYP|nr:hypothetical protein ADEAN_000249700 [Angomonas deanei]
METSVDGSWVPCTKVIPLIKSLLYVFNNMVVALQGKTADHYHHNVVTHVVVVDVVTILETPFSLVLQKEDFSAYKKPLQHTPTQYDTEHANLFAAANDPDNRPNYYYWPMEELDDAIKDHTKDAKGEGPLLNHTSKSVSIVEDRYLASCASWGVFVDESGDTFTPNLTHFLEERRQVAFQDTPSTPKVHATPPPRRPTEEPFATPRRSGSRAASTNTNAHHDEESAYLGRLTEMFNFRTPTSTPVGSARAALLNSSARKKMRSLRESSQCRSQQAHSSQILSQALLLTKLSQTPFTVMHQSTLLAHYTHRLLPSWTTVEAHTTARAIRC